jgi:transposase-like protein
MMPQEEDKLLEDFLQKFKDFKASTKTGETGTEAKNHGPGQNHDQNQSQQQDPLAYVLEKILNLLLEKEMTDFLDAEKYERTESREGRRNGYRERELHTRVGTLKLRVPRDREGNFSTAIFEKSQRSERALILALQEMYLQGVSTRRTKKITEKLCGTEFSKDQVSRMTKELDETINNWRTRPLSEETEIDAGIETESGTEEESSRSKKVEDIQDIQDAQDVKDPQDVEDVKDVKDVCKEAGRGSSDSSNPNPSSNSGSSSGRAYPYLMIDAIYQKVREGGRIRDRAVLLVVGVDETGHREILGTYMKASESAVSWGEVFSDLIERGLDPGSVRYIVSDKHVGMRKAIARFFPDSLWGWCQTHYQRNAKSRITGKEETKRLHQHLRDVFNSPNLKTAKARAEKLSEFYEGRYQDLAAWLEGTIEDALTVFHLPQKHRKRLRTNNCLERFNRELKRRTKVVGIFPNRDSCLRLVSALCMEKSEEWITGRRYVNEEDLGELLNSGEDKEKEETEESELDLQQEVVLA